MDGSLSDRVEADKTTVVLKHLNNGNTEAGEQNVTRVDRRGPMRAVMFTV